MMQQKELTAQVDSSFFTRFVDFSTGNAYNENGQRASSLWCGWHLKSEIDAGLWAGMLAGNGKTRSRCSRMIFDQMELYVGGRQKNQL